ncbi:unnamed protein product [Fraxinus pennsylvanica]|uniref:Uncharacterized protein n=1 Tax=Fraxinus pennsylvanica TaxID=56036 RepID=A0AAD2E2J5_9LAMI|nr:unnamed protein product [Fraxinus pennsylvanica]
MGESFTIQISSNLVRQLADDPEKVKPKPKKLKPKKQSEKVHTKQISDDSNARKGQAASGWPLQPPLYLPVPPPQSANSKLDDIRSVLQESEKVLERLNKQQENLLQEVTERAKELHDKEFKLPQQKHLPCLEEKDACLKCYKEHVKDPLKCASFVKDFADCARRVRQLVGSADK